MKLSIKQTAILIGACIGQTTLNYLWYHFFPSPTDIVLADPVTLIVVGVLAGTAITAYSAYQQGQAARIQGENEQRIANYNAEVQRRQAEYEAVLSERKAEEERLAAGEEAKRHEAAGEELMARQKGLYGKAGVLFRGSPLSVIEKTALQLEYDRQMILREGRVGYESYAAQATALRRFGKMSANIERMRGTSALLRGKAAARGATLSSIGTLLTGFGTAGYMKYQMPKIPQNDFLSTGMITGRG